MVESLSAASNQIDGKLRKESSLYQQSLSVKNSIEQSIQSWATGWEQASPMRSLSESFEDRLIFLVYGKVNVGKSSFCNFIVEQFPSEDIKKFRFNNGKVEAFEGKFKEGVVETTAIIQGVELGSRLVLLDSPGLHSVDEKNGELTKKFTDSADAVLWLTPSTSPGQVQELDDLKIELESKKPLQPVLTRSDFFEEDIDDNGEIVKVLKNKSHANRDLQEKDVVERTRKVLDPAVSLKQPVSISIHAYRSSDCADSFNEAGLQRLFEQLVSLTDEAREYKTKKAGRQVVNFLDKQVLQQLEETVIPMVNSLKNDATNAINNLKAKEKNITSLVLSDTCLAIPAIVEKHKYLQDKVALTQEVKQTIEASINQVLQQELREFTDRIQSVCSTLSSGAVGNFEDITVDIEKVSGSGARTFTSSAGAAAGAFLGSLLMPVIGTAIGGVVGGVAGSKAGDFFVDTTQVTEVIGVSTTRIIEKTTEAVRKEIPKLIEGAVEEVVIMVSATKEYAEAVNGVIKKFGTDVGRLKEQL